MTALMPERRPIQESAPAVRRGNARVYMAVVASGLTYEEIADQLAVDPKTVERWVNEPGRRPYARHAHAVARILGTTPWELWPAMRPQEPAPEPAAVGPQVLAAAQDALRRVEALDLGSASPTEMALHLGALSSVLRTVVDFIDPAMGDTA
ncbi:helix-turn-helix transcriptional regulator [Streptomyces erythrochromogenes]|uniref:helix-turn-helix domain-containing protein n=1 Tax=Streptomyces erythrochromogenes TaxID=285574 RepID=UPI003415943F